MSKWKNKILGMICMATAFVATLTNTTYAANNDYYKIGNTFRTDEFYANKTPRIAISGKAVQMYEIEIEHFSGKKVQER